MIRPEILPDDIAALRTLVLTAWAERDAERAEKARLVEERDQLAGQNDRLRHLIRQLQRMQFGRRSEKLDPEQLSLALEDLEQAVAAEEAEREKADYVGSSYGWQDFHQNGKMTWEYQSAGPGNVALIAELPRLVVLALGFGSSAEAAATLAISSLLQPFDSVLQQHIASWQAWHAERSERHAVRLDVPPALAEELLVSTIVLRTHQDKTYPGAIVASLSIPWGDSGNERGGYDLVWPRDLVETVAGADSRTA